MKIIDMKVSTLIEQTRKSSANPGGGAVLILTANLATNLILMMDKNEWKDLKEKADVSRETLLNISNKLTSLMQDDVDYFNDLMDKIKDDKAREDNYLKAASAIMAMVDLNLETLETLSFYLENGKKTTLTDGEIANNLLLETIKSAMPTIEVNLRYTNKNYHYDELVDEAIKLFERNKDIIERRKK